MKKKKNPFKKKGVFLNSRKVVIKRTNDDSVLKKKEE